MKIRLTTPALLLVGLLVFAACGGDDDDDSGSILGDNPSETTVADDSDAEAAADDEDDEADATDETDADDESDTSADESDDTASEDESDDESSSGGFSGDDSGDFCNYLEDAKDDVDELDLSEDLGPEALEDSFQKGRDALDGAVDRAPDEIRADVEKLSEYFGRLDDLLAEFDYSYTKLAQEAQSNPQAVAEFEELTSDPDLEAATERLEAYTEEVCGITE
jgi:hypothetical protein